jgi:2-polyprenyl-6-methoxyphenol hydroxylase-like FAD-dependent oxidoreductase
MRVLVSGAGPAGLTVAYWLKRYGFTPTLIESAPALRKGGYKIDVRGAALEVLRRMKIYDIITKASTDMQGALLVDKQGKIINEMSGDAFGHRTGDDLEIMRGTLCQILMDEIPQTEIIFGDSIRTVTQITDAVQVEFKQNNTRVFDLVIGADGLHSTVRQLVFGDESHFSHNLGIYLCVFTIPNYLNLDRMEIQYTELGRVAAIWSTRNETEARATFAFVSKISIEPRDLAAQQQLVRSVFEGIGGEVPKLLQMMPNALDFYFDVGAQIHMDRWSLNRVILLGDAAYCPSPLSGQGSSLALVGAYVLAGELAAAKGNFQTAFDQFEHQMRPFIKINQMLGINAAKLFRSQEKNNILAWLIEKIMKIAPGRAIEFFIDRSTKRIHRAANSITLKDY